MSAPMRAARDVSMLRLVHPEDEVRPPMNEPPRHVSDTLPFAPLSKPTRPTRRRWSDLFGLGTIPGTPDEARALFQRRLGLFFAICATIGWTFYVIHIVMVLIFGHHGLPTDLIDLMRIVHLTITLGATALWLWMRSMPRSIVALSFFDVTGTVVIVAGLATMLIGSPAITRPEIEMLLTINIILVSRAAMVPSTLGRTLIIGLLASAFLIAGACIVYSRGVDPALVTLDFDKGGIPPLPIILIAAATWSMITVGLTGLISRVIYGLQRHLEQAMRLGQYTLVEKIGEGGMGAVYRASHAMLRRPTAIKLLPAERAGARALQRFEREVQLTALLTHPNTVAIYDYGRTPDGIFYYAMEYLEGLDLEVLVERRGPQPAARVLHVLVQVTGALSEAHAAGLIHRDIKPANVILCQRGGVSDFAKVVDFGLVKELKPSSTSASASSAGNVITGTPLYLAPEAIVAPDTIDARADLYALGAVAYWLLTGTPVFDAPTLLEICAKHLHADVELPSVRGKRELPSALEALVLQCLEKDPAKRPASAAALGASLRALVERGEVAVWTDDQASRWWSDNAEDTKRRRSPSASPLGQTVGIDLGERMAARA